MLNLHENKNFVAYSMAFSKGEFEVAEIELLPVISDARNQLSYLYQRLADI